MYLLSRKPLRAVVFLSAVVLSVATSAVGYYDDLSVSKSVFINAVGIDTFFIDIHLNEEAVDASASTESFQANYYFTKPEDVDSGTVRLTLSRGSLTLASATHTITPNLTTQYGELYTEELTLGCSGGVACEQNFELHVDLPDDVEVMFPSVGAVISGAWKSQDKYDDSDITFDVY
jgi:hypothetical protein